MEQIHLFNKPLEFGLRLLIIIDAHKFTPISLDRLVILDYLLVHIGDISDYQSIHVDTPNRIQEALINRKNIEQGLNLMISKGLLKKIYMESGICYSSTEITAVFKNLLESPYSKKLVENSLTLMCLVKELDDEQLFNKTVYCLEKWNEEFEKLII